MAPLIIPVTIPQYIVELYIDQYYAAFDRYPTDDEIRDYFVQYISKTVDYSDL